MCRLHENTGTGTTACLRRSTRCGGPSRRWRKGKVGKRSNAATGMPPVTAAILEKSTAPTTRHAKAWAKLMAQVGEEFPLLCPFLRRRYSAQLFDTQVDTQAALQTAGAVSLRTEGSQTDEGQNGFVRVKPDSHTSLRAARTSARLSRSRPADRLRRIRLGASRRRDRPDRARLYCPRSTSTCEGRRDPPPQSGTRRRAAPTVKNCSHSGGGGSFKATAQPDVL